MTQVSMYASFFGLSEAPFSIAPDPRFLYMSRKHREAMAHLAYGIQEGGGFVQLTGEVGTGKTTLCRCLLMQLPNHVDAALILNPQIKNSELLAALCDEMGIEYAKDATPIRLLNALNEHLLETYAQGRRTVLIIEEAQLLTRAVLEQVRILTNLETTRQKLLQIILIGQPELSSTLGRSDLRQLSQRITARYHLEPLSLGDTREYVKYRLAVAGCTRSLFSGTALRRVHKYSGGVPRLINVICDRALLGAYARNEKSVSARVVRKAAGEVLGDSARHRGRTWWAPAVTMVMVVGVLLLFPYTREGVFDAGRRVQSLYTQAVETARSSFRSLVQHGSRTNIGGGVRPPGVDPRGDGGDGTAAASISDTVGR
jgi:general secretion pathway protein A